MLCDQQLRPSGFPPGHIGHPMLVPMPAAVHSLAAKATTPPSGLPRWPLTLSFAGFPLWWLLGPGEFAWVPFAGVMALYLGRQRRVRVPKWFGIWLLFLAWLVFSGIGVDSPGRMLGFVYRAARYVGATIFFIYVYNARTTLTARYVAGILTVFWLVVTVGGYAGLFFPLFQVKTALSFVMPASLASNELVGEMIIRRVTQFDPHAFSATTPRPSAPFLYTNGWGNAYSLLMPIVLAYLSMVRRERKFWWLLLAVPASAVPALLTLNRGMFLGLAVAFVYAAVRFTLLGRIRAVVSLAAVVAVLALVAVQLPVAQSLADRLATSSTTQDRYSLYVETFRRTLESPLFGFGAPRPSVQAGLPSAGTQGQIWMLMFSHGFPAVALFFGWLTAVFLQTLRQRSVVGIAANTTLLVLMVESLYYGVVPVGLTIALLVAAVALRPPTHEDRAPLPGVVSSDVPRRMFDPRHAEEPSIDAV